MNIMQGDEYDVFLTLTDADGEPITTEGVTDVEVGLGGLFFSLTGNTLSYNSDRGAWVFRLEEDKTEAMKGVLSFQVRVTFDNSDIVGTRLPLVYVTTSMQRPAPAPDEGTEEI